MFHRLFDQRIGRRFIRSEDEGDGLSRSRRGGAGGRDHGFGGGFGGGIGRGRGGFAEGGIRRGRIFDHGELRHVILALIAERPRHGYEIIKEIEDRLAGAYSPSPGVVYPTLTMLDEIGYATVAEGGSSKKLYSITPQGEAFLIEHRREVDAILARMKQAGEASSGERSPQVMRAIQNLKLALHLRLSRGALSDEQARAITAALDTAVAAIERT